MSATTETLDALYLAELAALDAFAARREVLGGLIPGRDDPDVRRILEAMAFFSARTRAAATGAMADAVRRGAAGTLDDLLAASPAARLVQAAPDESLVEPVVLPGGSQIRAVTPEGRVGIFSLERPLAVLPLILEGAEIVELRRRLFVRIRLRALRPPRGPAQLSFYVRRLGDYRASLALHDALEQHLVRAFALADGEGPDLPCPVAFGAPRPLRLEDGAGEPGPLAQIRAFFHLPERELYVHVSVPATPTPWSTLSIHLELDEAFPTDVSVSSDAFHLFVAPAINAWTDLAAPILCDGTRDRYPVQNPNPVLEEVELAGVRGVYRGTDRGLSPILPAALAREGDTYELCTAGDDGDAALALHVADAFERPCKVQVDARWSQPSLWSAAVGRRALSLETRHRPAVGFHALGPVRRPAESPLARDPARCLDVMALRTRPALTRRDVAGLLDILGTSGDGPYRGAHTLIEDLTVTDATDPGRRSSGIRWVYRLAMRRRSPEDAPLLRRLTAHVVALLELWTEDAVRVDVDIQTHADDPRLALPGGAPR